MGKFSERSIWTRAARAITGQQVTVEAAAMPVTWPVRAEYRRRAGEAVITLYFDRRATEDEMLHAFLHECAHVKLDHKGAPMTVRDTFNAERTAQYRETRAEREAEAEAERMMKACKKVVGDDCSGGYQVAMLTAAMKLFGE